MVEQGYNVSSLGQKELIKASIYIRVSTLDQTTLNQEIFLKDWALKNGFEIVKIYKDEGVSGAKISREALDLMMQDLRKKEFDAVIVWKLDRLGRSTQHLLQVLQEMQNKNVRLVITDMNLDTATPQGKFFFTIIGAVAELEREMIRERIILGIARKKAQGIKLGRPFGSKDKGNRRKSGYMMRWVKDRQSKSAKETGVIEGVEKFVK